MTFTGSTYFNLPQVENFSFFISGIRTSDLKYFSFNFIDANGFVFPFVFESGLVHANKIICGYNNKELYNIEGYVKNGDLFYKINEIYGKATGHFSNLNKLSILISGDPIDCSLFFYSDPINYSFSLNPQYSLSGNLTGNFNSDVLFEIKDLSLKFLNSTEDLLEIDSSSVLFKDNIIYPGNNYFILKDIDSSNFEYNNPFITYTNTIFNELNFTKSSYRGDVYSKNVINITENPTNNYTGYSLFDGIWSGNNFIYTGERAILNLFFDLESLDYFGNELPISGKLNFDLFSAYRFKNYITGFKLTNSGLYSGEEPSLEFSKYYYVNGISQAFENLLFSSDCSNKIFINYSGNSSGSASGYLDARNVYISGIYGNGINKFKAIFGYTSYSYGSGYTGAPIILWGTGGNCFSIADVSGESGQFKKIHNTKASIQAHADYLTGYPLTSGITGLGGVVTGYIVTGLQITNIGSGYNETFPAKINFLRWSGDNLNNNTSGYFNYINYIDIDSVFKNFKISYNFLDSNDYVLSLDIYDAFTGAFIKPYGKNTINVKIEHNFDYINSIKTPLIFQIYNYDYSRTFQKDIVLNKIYNPDPNALI